MALEEVLKTQALVQPERDVSEIRVIPSAALHGRRRLAVSPPVVMVEKSGSVDEVRRYVARNAPAGVVRQVLGAAVEPGVVLVGFERSAERMHATYLVKFFEDDKETKMVGSLAKPEDMERLDPGRVIEWSLEEYLDYGQKAKDQQDEAKIAAVKEKQRSSKLEEEKQAIKLDVTKVEQQFVDKLYEIEKLKKGHAKQKERFEVCCDREQANSQRELRDMETHHEKKWKQLNLEMDFTHRKIEKQRMEHLELLERLKEKRNSGTEQANANSTILLELEDEKTSFEKSLKTAEDGLNNQFRLMEMELMEEHNKEIEELSVKYAEQSEDCLKMQECSICFEELGEKERARCVLNPCWHAKACMACSRPITECPICRAPIKSKMPLAVSQPFYG